MENSISERIDLLIKRLGFNKNSFSQKIGLNNNVTIGNIINKNSKPSFDVLEKITLTFNSIDLNWLITGRGEMLINEVKTEISGNTSQVNEAAAVYQTAKTSGECEFLKKEIEFLKTEIQLKDKIIYLLENR